MHAELRCIAAPCMTWPPGKRVRLRPPASSRGRGALEAPSKNWRRTGTTRPRERTTRRERAGCVAETNRLGTKRTRSEWLYRPKVLTTRREGSDAMESERAPRCVQPQPPDRGPEPPSIRTLPCGLSKGPDPTRLLCGPATPAHIPRCAHMHVEVGRRHHRTSVCMGLATIQTQGSPGWQPRSKSYDADVQHSSPNPDEANDWSLGRIYRSVP